MLTTRYTPAPRDDYPDPDQSEWRYLVFCVGVLVLLFGVIALIGLAASRWWPWLLA